jgi:predicted ATPase
MDSTSLPIESDHSRDRARFALRPPALAKRLLGRSEELARVAELLQESRFVTIVGPGGMGKTTLARAVAAHCEELYPDGVHIVDLAVLAEGRELAGALGVALGIERLTREGLAQLAPALRGQRLLIVFDCCEHHTGVAAHASEALLRATPGIDVLCTSREPLLAHGERIVRLGPIGLPGSAEASDAALAARVPAVELFVARAHGGGAAGFVLDDSNVALVCAICRAVEGSPLALELAAALVRPLGLHKLAQQTSRWLLEPASADRQAGDRHRTVSSMLDWSYDALAPEEQRVLRCLAVFRGGFTLEAAAAAAVAAGEGLEREEVLDTVIELAGKSLVSMSGDGGRRPRLLDLTREYAYDKLVRSGELKAVQRRHADWLGALMDDLDRDWMAMSRNEWVALYSPWIDDILAAIDWCLGPGGDALLAGKLAVVGFSVGDQLGYSREFQGRVQRALDAARQLPDPPPAIMLRLLTVAANGRDPSSRPFMEFKDEFEHCMALAHRTGRPLLQGGPLISLWGSPYVRGDYPASLAGAERMAKVARDSADPVLELIGQRTMAQSLHFLGRHREARDLAALTLANSHRRIPLPCLPSPMDAGTSIRITIARMLWMEGAADQALAMSEEALALSESDRPVAMCQVLAMGSVPVALWRGETARAAQLARRMRERAERHGMGYWADWARRFEHGIDVIEGRAEAHNGDSFTDTQAFSAKCRDHLATFSPLLLTEDAIARVEAGTVGWCAPELLRAQALRRLSADAIDGGGAAAALLRRSLAMAEEQGALGWSLRSATGLASLYRHQGTVAQARAVLEPVLARCREGEGTADLRAAHALVASLY